MRWNPRQKYLLLSSEPSKQKFALCGWDLSVLMFLFSKDMYFIDYFFVIFEEMPKYHFLWFLKNLLVWVIHLEAFETRIAILSLYKHM
jgi:hypothetical protein